MPERLEIGKSIKSVSKAQKASCSACSNREWGQQPRKCGLKLLSNEMAFGCKENLATVIETGNKTADGAVVLELMNKVVGAHKVEVFQSAMRKRTVLVTDQSTRS